MNKTQEMETEKNATLQQMEKHVARWQEGLDQLEEELKTIRVDARASYEEKIAKLRADWEQVYARVKALEEGSREEWENAKAYLNQRVTTFRQDFLKTARRLQTEEKVPLGWLQGFTDERKVESDGWAQGLGDRPQGSKGWAEGQGKQPEGSKGWAEGYKETA